MSSELLSTARLLARASPRRPRQADLRRAISTAYYAMFDAFARNGADLLVGVTASIPHKAWTQTYRALDHGAAKQACGQLRTLGFPPNLCDCGETFVQLQEARHKADYDPHHRVTRTEALAAIQAAEAAIKGLVASDRRDRKAFAVQLLFKRR